jgi:ABC-type glycerol-3-phosphate transport system substrate-binding protein
MKNLKKVFSKITAILIITFLVLGLIGCKKKPPAAKLPPVSLTYYKLFDDTTAIDPIIKNFQKQYPHIQINYRKFTDPQAYEDLIVSEIAEGTGPDIFSMPQTWIANNYKKLTPAPTDLIPEEAYKNTFLDIAWKDLAYKTGENETPEIYGVPLSIDTLAVYYNKDHFEKKIPEQGKPSNSWIGLNADILKLKELDADNKLLIAGAQLGNPSYQARTMDIILNILLQSQTKLYDKSYKNIRLTSQDVVDAFEYYTNFANPQSPSFTALELATSESAIDQFVKGEISMLLDYSHAYKDIIDRIKIYERANKQTIDPTSVRISKLPQLSDNPNDEINLASYFVETVSRTSKHPRESWAFLRFLVSQESLRSYYKTGGFKPTSRRDLINEQKQNAIYRPFVEQLGFARTFPMTDQTSYRNYFDNAVTKIIEGYGIENVLLETQNLINQTILNPNGFVPPQAD